jgi:hypothetical protein
MSRKSIEANPPVLRHVVNLWTLVWHPTKNREWSLERKLRAVKDAGFDGFTTQLTPQHANLADKLGLMCVGYFSSSDSRKFSSLLRSQKEAGAFHVNVQLGDHDTPTSIAQSLARKLVAEGNKLGLAVAIEVHRDTCTETPEKTFALAAAYEKATGELIPFVWDYSHLAVVKHLLPPFWPRLDQRPDLIQRAQQFHFRPFNGHHCQVPVTNGHGKLTPEFLDYVPFMEKVIGTWLASANPGREMIAVPELGPLWMGYNLSAFPPSWEDACVLRGEIDRSWQRILKRWRPPACRRPLPCA